ncbi:MAG: phosphopantothenoylcysteine decarboxylase [Paludisphaera borealis]|uniref:phosphopantothenoylcysteine decarboxylase domain-containing protein n=1 Tax=Paludisphaera borealis TaxID=1387353 RepID=UPI00284EA00D|nr:phosphopantothenoylcysteine decarboxylase [Paludisphaera borealis]MDR3622181.1 phosphopantothenoylcysteine decarboxylase [Paludisphaera borealis]
MKVVVTGGGTSAPIDDVRVITNVSTGRTAAAITECCLERGAEVWHIHTPSAQLPFLRSAGFNLDAADPRREHERLDRLQAKWRSVGDRLHLRPLEVGTVAEYADALRIVLTTQDVDLAFLPMAVSDYEPEPHEGKISSKRDELSIPCKRTPKVIRAVRDWSPTVYLVGFKLQSNVDRDELIRQAHDACLINRADLTVANDLTDVKAGRHALYLVRPGRPTALLEPGADLADRLVEHVWEWAKK